MCTESNSIFFLFANSVGIFRFPFAVFVNKNWLSRDRTTMVFREHSPTTVRQIVTQSAQSAPSPSQQPHQHKNRHDEDPEYFRALADALHIFPPCHKRAESLDSPTCLGAVTRKGKHKISKLLFVWHRRNDTLRLPSKWTFG